MAEKKGENESLEITVHGMKAPVGFIARTFFPDQTASAEALATLSRTATEKNVRGLPLTPEESAAFSVAMAPIWKKAARVRALVAQADEIYSSATKALPAPSVGTRAETPPEAPSEAFRDRWVAGAELASDVHVEEMWARILAGEVRRPGSFSFKTLSVLKDIETPVAEAFVAALGFLLDDHALPPLGRFEKSYRALGVPYDAMLSLSENGLVHLEDTALSSSPDSPFDILCGGVPMRVVPNLSELSVHALTQAGRELARVIERKPRRECVVALGDWLSRMAGLGKVEVALPTEGEHPPAEFRPWRADALEFDDDGTVRFSTTQTSET